LKPRSRKLGLLGVIFISFTATLLVILAVLFVLVPRQVEEYLERSLERRAIQVAREVRGHFPTERLAEAGEVALLEVEADGIFEVVVVARDDQGGAARLVGRTAAGERLAEQVVNAAWREPPVRQGIPAGLLVAEPISGPNGVAGYVMAVGSTRELGEVLGAVRATLLVAFGLGFGVLSLAFFVVSRRLIVQPLQAMMHSASKLSEADLTGSVEVSSSDELGQLAEALNRIGQSLRDTLGRIRGVSEGVAQVIEQISRTGTTVSSGASTIQGRVEETSASMVEMLASLRGIAENVEVLYQSAEESSSSIMQMAATNDEVAENVQAMAASVEETTSAIEQMTISIKEVARNVEALLASTEETSTSMKQMDISIGQVEMNANETARLSEQVSQDAETGVLALHKTLAGIDKIKDSSRSASTVIESLGKRIGEIGNIVDVIDDVAEQTNLLALNAAIIAAQAGEHGKGFAVVAEEIKELAERTGTSTREIAELIRAVQQESRNAAQAMNHGVKSVDEGVQLGREAEGALKKISDSANKATLMVKAIARATVEQARGSKQVTGAIQRIAESVQQISVATSAQAKGSEQVIKGAERMKLLTSHVQRSSQEQAHGSRQITRSIENINEMVTHLNRAQKEQTEGSDQVLKAVEAIKAVSEHQTRSVRQLEEAIESLQRQAEVLRSEVRRFRV
jgi:methyl-accepting chemotaxis protein